MNILIRKLSQYLLSSFRFFDPTKLFAMLIVGGLIFMVFLAFIFFHILLKMGIRDNKFTKKAPQ